jgi:outer membrane protein OmpA-like peptidoglycan-associated protein
MYRLYTLIALFVLVFSAGQAQSTVTIRNCTRINSAALDFSPAYYGNGMVFVSSRKNTGEVDKVTGETYFELYYADFDENGYPIHPTPFSAEINSDRHEGQVSFTSKSDKMFFSRNSISKGVAQAGKDDTVRMRVYEAHKGLYDWERVRPLPFNNVNYSCMHPSLSYDGNRLFFASNMPGGYGKMDIYFVDWDGSKWSDPINLGPDVNTPGNEVFPYTHDNGALFFSSTGLRGLGGLDIYMIDLSGSNWGKVINLGQPFNSKADDFGLILDKESTRGFFSSNRNGGLGKDDIYAFEAPSGIQGLKPVVHASLRIAAIDEENNASMPNVNIRIFERANDGLIKDGNTYSATLVPANDQSDDLIMRLNRKNEEDLGSPTAVTGRDGSVTVNLAVNREYVLLISKSGFKTQELPFFPKAQNLKNTLEVRMAHINCIPLKGIALTDKYEKPIPNTKVRIISNCNKQEVLLSSNLDGSFDYCLDLGCTYTILAEKYGYKPSQTQLSTENVRGSRSFSVSMHLVPNSEEVMSKPLAEGTVIVMENIYYDFNKAAIRTSDARDLDALTRLMLKYPTMEVELGAHTDSRGTTEYNQQLSERRAEAAKEYLVRKGVAANRIRTKGFGESQVRNHCKDGVECTEKEHQFNRRTEVRVLKINESAAYELKN